MFGHFTYVLFETLWAIPVLLVQWVVGARILRRNGRTLLLAIAVPTIYLSGADAVAISHGIWVLHGTRILGLRIGNLPVEEALFFLLTNAMVAQSVVLLLEWHSSNSDRAYHGDRDDANIVQRFDRTLPSS